MSIKIFSYIVSSIVGTGILILPATVIKYGLNAIIGLGLSTIIFTGVGYLFAQTSQPFNDIKKYTPSVIYKFISISYWIFSWSSTIVITYEMANAILKLLNYTQNSLNISILQIIIIVSFIGLHKLGIHRVNKIEICVTVLKIIVLSFIPIIFIIYSVQNGISINTNISLKSIIAVIPSMMWMYLGLESCSIVNQEKNNVKSIILGILCVFGIYCMNIFSILLTMDNLTDLAAPQAQVIGKIFNQWYPTMAVFAEKFIAICIIILCAGSINSWYVLSANTFESLTDIVPKKYNNSYFKSVLFSSIGLIPLACIVSSPNIKTTYEKIFDNFSIIISVFYLICTYVIMKKYKYYKLGIPIIITFIIFISYSLINLFANNF